MQVFTGLHHFDLCVSTPNILSLLSTTTHMHLPQSLTLVLSIVAMVLVCILVHVLINKQKWVAFHKIEKSVLARLDVEKEYRKQVTQ